MDPCSAPEFEHNHCILISCPSRFATIGYARARGFRHFLVELCAVLGSVELEPTPSVSFLLPQVQSNIHGRWLWQWLQARNLSRVAAANSRLRPSTYRCLLFGVSYFYVNLGNGCSSWRSDVGLHAIIEGDSSDIRYPSFFSYFTNLTFIGTCSYFFAAGVQTFFFARKHRVGSGEEYPLQEWPRLLQYLHVLLSSTVMTFRKLSCLTLTFKLSSSFKLFLSPSSTGLY